MALPEGYPDFVLPLAREPRVIEAFHEARAGLSSSEAAARAGLSRAATRRLLPTLERLGYAERGGAGFQLTRRVPRLGSSFATSNSMATPALPILEQLSAHIHESCPVSVLDGEQIVYLARAAPRRVMTIDLGVGSRLPAYCTSMGRVPPAALPRALTPKTLRDRRKPAAGMNSGVHAARVSPAELLRRILPPLRQHAGLLGQMLP